MEYVKKSFEIKKKLKLPNSDFALDYNNLGSVYYEMNDLAQAMENLKKSLEIKE